MPIPLEDRAIIIYEGLQDMDTTGINKKVTYTSLRTGSTGLMEIEQFKKEYMKIDKVLVRNKEVYILRG